VLETRSTSKGSNDTFTEKLRSCQVSNVRNILGPPKSNPEHYIHCYSLLPPSGPNAAPCVLHAQPIET